MTYLHIFEYDRAGLSSECKFSTVPYKNVHILVFEIHYDTTIVISYSILPLGFRIIMKDFRFRLKTDDNLGIRLI